MSAAIYHPKGSMCGSCKKFMDNCTQLPFKDMKVIQTYTQGSDPTIFKVVRCTEYERTK